MQAHGWTLLFHKCLTSQVSRLRDAAERARLQEPESYQHNANVKLYSAISRLIFDVIPADPARDEYRQGNTMGPEYRHWRRAKIGRRFRLFFRFDTKSRTIIFAWINDENTLRSSGGKRDPYAVFQQILNRGNPPDAWSELVAACSTDWK